MWQIGLTQYLANELENLGDRLDEPPLDDRRLPRAKHLLVEGNADILENIK